MSKAIKCKILQIYMAEHECVLSQKNGHHYCKKCARYSAPSTVAKPPHPYYRFLKEMIFSAVEIVANGKMWIDSRSAYWTQRGYPASRYGRRRFMKDLRDSSRIYDDIRDTKEWFLSEAKAPGSFVWICDNLREIHCTDSGFSPDALRKKMELI